jgi:hypothetical protein
MTDMAAEVGMVITEVIAVNIVAIVTNQWCGTA